MASWYCICTRRYKEHWVAHQLMLSCEEVYLPLSRQWRKVRRQFKWVIDPLFPCYLFSRFAEDKFHTVCHLRGVASLLSTCEGEPIEVDEQIIVTLRKRSASGYVIVNSLWPQGRVPQHFFSLT